MRVFQDQYQGGDGKTRTAESWSVKLTDHKGVLRQIATGQRDKKTAEAVGRSLERLVRCRVSGEPLDPVTAKWLEDISPRLRATLGKFGLLDAARIAALRPLTEHIDGIDGEPGWKQYLISKGNTPLHIDRFTKCVHQALEGSGATYWSDISVTRIMTWLNGQRADEFNAAGKRTRRGIGAASANRFVTALKGFGRWMQREGRVSDTPLEGLRKLNAKIDKRRPRRALDVNELRWLLEATRKGPTRAKMSGPERVMLYRVATETGLRANELRNLTRLSFQLDGNYPTVTGQASFSKRRRDDVLPLRHDTAAELREFFGDKPPTAKAFNMPDDSSDVVRRLFRPDLAAARRRWIIAAATPEEREQREASYTLCYVDAAGRYADFHALRHTTGTLLVAGGANPKTVQSLMRHSDINLTMSLYTHTVVSQEAAAIAALPSFGTAPTQQQAKPTDTNDATATTANDAAATGGNNAMATSENNAAASAGNTPAEAVKMPAAANSPQNSPGNTAKSSPENSPRNSPFLCGLLATRTVKSGQMGVIGENAENDEKHQENVGFLRKKEKPTLGVEPKTSALRKPCSTIELGRRVDTSIEVLL